MPQRTGNAPTGMKALAKAGITTIIVIARLVASVAHIERVWRFCGSMRIRPPRAKRARPRNDAQAHPLLVVDPGRSSGSEYASLVS
jgi:hypothetical protein